MAHPPKRGKPTQKRGEFGPQTLGGAEKGAKIQAKGSRCARHLARIFDQRPPRLFGDVFENLGGRRSKIRAKCRPGGYYPGVLAPPRSPMAPSPSTARPQQKAFCAMCIISCVCRSAVCRCDGKRPPIFSFRLPQSRQQKKNRRPQVKNSSQRTRAATSFGQNFCSLSRPPDCLGSNLPPLL
jgi:hypothetical protein